MQRFSVCFSERVCPKLRLHDSPRRLHILLHYLTISLFSSRNVSPTSFKNVGIEAVQKSVPVQKSKNAEKFFFAANIGFDIVENEPLKV